MRFIVLHHNTFRASNEVIVNLDNINLIYPSKEGGSLIYMAHDDDPAVVSESPREVMNLILNTK